MAKVKRTSNWERPTIAREIGAVHTELSRLQVSDKEKVELCLERIEELEGSDSPVAPLRRFLYVVQALIHHEVSGALNERQIRSLTKLGEGILMANRISPTSSTLSFLYGQLHLALANIYRRTGDLWRSTWQQQIAYTLSQRTPAGGKGNQRYFMGVSAARFGLPRLTERWLDPKTLEGVEASEQTRAKLEQIKLKRLTGDLEGTKEAAREFLKDKFLPRSVRLEPEWELLCCEAQEKQSIDALMAAVQKGQDHHQPAYIMEAFLWSRSVKSKKWIQKYGSLKKLTRDAQITYRKDDSVFKCIQVLEKAYDGSIPYIHRLIEMEKIVTRSQGLFGLEAELLLNACVIRWLSRNRSYWLMGLTLESYRAESFRLSHGKCSDVLHVLEDLDPLEKLEEEDKAA